MLHLTKLFIEDARIESTKTSVTLSFFDTYTTFECPDTNWQCFSCNGFMVCCYVDPALEMKDYLPDSFTFKFMSTGNDAKLVPIKNSKINHPLRCLVVKGPVALTASVYSLSPFSFYANRGASMNVAGHEMDLRIKEKNDSVIRVVGSVAKIVVEILEVSCTLDVSSCRINPRGMLLLNVDSTGKLIADPDINRILSAAGSFFKPVPTSRQIYVKEVIRIPSHEKARVACSDDPVCQLCCEYVADARFKPCNHDLGCLQCAESMRLVEFSNFTCPWCRTEINSVKASSPRQKRVR